MIIVLKKKRKEKDINPKYVLLAISTPTNQPRSIQPIIFWRKPCHSKELLWQRWKGKLKNGQSLDLKKSLLLQVCHYLACKDHRLRTNSITLLYFYLTTWGTFISELVALSCHRINHMSDRLIEDPCRNDNYFLYFNRYIPHSSVVVHMDHLFQ